MHTEKKQQDYGAPPHPGEGWSGHNPLILSTDNKVTGATTYMLRKENKKRYNCQEDQGPQAYWSNMKEHLGCQPSFQQLESTEITCAHRVWQFIT